VIGAFYDTNIFVLSLNAADPDGTHCVKLLDANHICWRVGLSEITRGESSISEYVDELLSGFAAAGVDFIEVSEAEIKSKIKTKRDVKRKLEILGVSPRDARQAFAAFSMAADLLVVRDFDFRDPAFKARMSDGGRIGRVERLLSTAFGYKVAFPVDALEALNC
jgi:hypothetical protein